MVIYKTYSSGNNKYNYWIDILPGHHSYDLIVGQSIISQELSNKILEMGYDHKIYVRMCYDNGDKDNSNDI